MAERNMILIFLILFAMFKVNDVQNLSSDKQEYKYKSVCQVTKSFDDSMKIRFNILEEEINRYKGTQYPDTEISATVEHSNFTDQEITMTKRLIYGLKSVGDSHIEVVDHEGKTVDVEMEMDYDYLFDELFDTVNLSINGTKLDTINLSVFYKFEVEGVYKVRFVSREFNTVSNWDTLIVK